MPVAVSIGNLERKSIILEESIHQTQTPPLVRKKV
jgi:hypothetical protein